MTVDIEGLKTSLMEALDRRRDELLSFWTDLHLHPEHGYFEFRTSAKAAEVLSGLGFQVQTGLGRTGLRAVLECGAPGPTVAILGELDAVTCRNYPQADLTTGASHTCGHDFQMAGLLGCAMALKDSGAAQSLCGRIVFIAVPAEEYIMIGERLRLREAGEIGYLGGKQELVRLGAFDDVQIAMMVHAGCGDDFTLPEGCNGFRAYSVAYQGRQAHAAGEPHKGVNALYAALSGMNGVNALRETFRDEDHLRVHYIITKGGDAVNAIPDDVGLEGYLRAATLDAIDRAFPSVRSAFLAGGDALGARCVVRALPGYLPLHPNRQLEEIFSANVRYTGSGITRAGWSAGSTDMGDISCLMPALHPHSGGCSGSFHGADYKVENVDKALIDPARALLGTLVDLLSDGGAKAQAVIKDFTPRLTKAEYLRRLNGWFDETANRPDRP